MRSSIPVSYTHLDVYKRQRYEMGEGLEKRNECFADEVAAQLNK